MRKRHINVPVRSAYPRITSYDARADNKASDVITVYLDKFFKRTSKTQPKPVKLPPAL